MRFIIFVSIFFLSVTYVWATETDNSAFIDLLKDMHQQIEKWQTQLGEIEKDPTIPTVEKGVIKTIRSLLRHIDEVLKGYLPPEPKVKKTRSSRQKVLRHASPVVSLIPPLTG
ncbi:MAG: hypothetical protein J7J46_01160 [Candidatus Desulfofervidus sp.]|nr:hypothetical protein [Candidatus Desulfofervidus sp.]